MSLSEGTLYALVVGCEAAFWVALSSGLAVRYLLQWRRVSWFLLLCVPLIDVVLLALTVLDLRNGAIATFAHGLATAYVGFTVAFGSVIIRWADQWLAHKLGKGPPPTTLPSYGWATVLYELKLWCRCVLAACIIYILLIVVIGFVDQPSRTEALYIWFRIPLGTVTFWFIFGPLWSVIFFRRPASKT